MRACRSQRRPHSWGGGGGGGASQPAPGVPRGGGGRTWPAFPARRQGTRASLPTQDHRDRASAEAPAGSGPLTRPAEKATMLAVCRSPFLVSSWGKCFQNAALLGQWGKASPHSFRTCAVLRPRGWKSPVNQVLLPRCLGILAPSQRTQEQNTTGSTNDFKLIYRFPGIRYCRALSRLKLLQTLLTVVILPPIWLLCWQNQVTQAQCLYSTGIACFAGVMLYAMSYYFRRIIGMMYLNKDGTVLRVAHLTFWGKRKDFCCPVETVMTLGDLGEDQNELLLQFKQYDRDQFLYFTLRFGQVLDRDGFAKVFGGVQ